VPGQLHSRDVRMIKVDLDRRTERISSLKALRNSLGHRYLVLRGIDVFANIRSINHDDIVPAVFKSEELIWTQLQLADTSGDYRSIRLLDDIAGAIFLGPKYMKQTVVPSRIIQEDSRNSILSSVLAVRKVRALYIFLSKDHPRKGDHESHCKRKGRNSIEQEQLVYISKTQVHCVCRLDILGVAVGGPYKYGRPPRGG
jgi:hypothetical protein